MTNEQLEIITCEIREYIRRKADETGDNPNIVCLAISRAVLLDGIERSEQHLKEVGFRDKLLDFKLTDFSISVRSLNCMKINGIETIRDLVRLQRTEFRDMRLVGPKTRSEIEDFLSDYGFDFGMDV